MRRTQLPHRYAGWLALLLMLLGGAMIVLGAARGETDIVFIKAVHVCMECIGLG